MWDTQSLEAGDEQMPELRAYVSWSCGVTEYRMWPVCSQELTDIKTLSRLGRECCKLHWTSHWDDWLLRTLHQTDGWVSATWKHKSYITGLCRGKKELVSLLYASAVYSSSLLILLRGCRITLCQAWLHQSPTGIISVPQGPNRNIYPLPNGQIMPTAIFSPHFKKW